MLKMSNWQPTAAWVPIHDDKSCDGYRGAKSNKTISQNMEEQEKRPGLQRIELWTDLMQS